jgi:hydrogenase maturation protease
MRPRILVAGIGNIFLGDDAFGCEVIQSMLRCGSPDNVRVEDFGIRGFDLAYALMDDYEAVILVDALPRGEQPGTLFIIEPDLGKLDDQSPAELMVDTHGMDPVKVLTLVKALGGEPKRVLVVGCEPERLADVDGERMGLSEPVQAAVDEAVKVVESLITRITGDQKTVVIEKGER